MYNDKKNTENSLKEPNPKWIISSLNYTNHCNTFILSKEFHLNIENIKYHIFVRKIKNIFLV